MWPIVHKKSYAALAQGDDLWHVDLVEGGEQRRGGLSGDQDLRPPGRSESPKKTAAWPSGPTFAEQCIVRTPSCGSR